MDRGIITITENGAFTMPTAPVWMTQQEMCDTFNVFGCYIRKAIAAIYKNNELSEEETVRHVRQDGRAAGGEGGVIRALARLQARGLLRLRAGEKDGEVIVGAQRRGERIAPLHHGQRPRRQQESGAQRIMRTVIGMVGDLLPETGGLEHLAPQAAEVHIAERRRAPIGAARREGEVEVVHMHHAARERLREQRGERCLAA